MKSIALNLSKLWHHQLPQHKNWHPYIFTGMRLSLGIAWLVIVAAEMLTGGIGIGFWIWDEYNNLAYHNIIIGIVVVGLVGFILDVFMGKIADYFDYRKKM